MFPHGHAALVCRCVRALTLSRWKTIVDLGSFPSQNRFNDVADVIKNTSHVMSALVNWREKKSLNWYHVYNIKKQGFQNVGPTITAKIDYARHQKMRAHGKNVLQPPMVALAVPTDGGGVLWASCLTLTDPTP